MSFALYNLVVRLFLVTALVAPGPQNLLQGEQLAQVQAAYSQTVDERSELVAQLRERESEYRSLLSQVDLLKNAPNTLQNRMELEDLLRESRALAEQMQKLQQKIKAAERQLTNQRRQLVAAIDAQMKQMESKLAETPTAKRKKVVRQLNELRAQRQQFTAPLPEAPSDGEVSEALAMIDELEGASAEDLMAAADELQDTEDQVRKRLGAIQQRIVELREAKMLARRARTFSAEERFFDETDRSRFIGRYEQRSSGSPTSGDVNSGVDGEAGYEDGGAVGDPSPTSPSPPATDGDGRSGFDNGGGTPEAPADPGEQGGDSSGDVFDEGQGEFMLDGQADPQTSNGTGFESDDHLDGRIERLEREQKRLEQQAGQLEEKAKNLRERARDTLD